MRTVNLKKYRVFILSAFLWLAIDLFSKSIVQNSNCCSAVLIKDFFYLTSQTNTGIAFGIEMNFWLQILATVIIMAALLHIGFKQLFKIKKNAFLNQLLLGIIIGGALGNLTNKLTLGYVVDFIALKPFPVFNIADIGITIGLITLFLLNLKTNKKT